MEGSHMYFVAVVLPKELDEVVIGYKKWMEQNYGCRVGLKSPAHITLIPPFWMDVQKEPFFLEKVSQASAGMHSFSLSTNHFSAFKPRTIFVDVKASKDLLDLKRRTDDILTGPETGIKREDRPFHPHITIATRDLYKKDFHEAWPVFQQKKMDATWQVTGISVLRHNKKNWDVIFTSQFS